jgi:hypothetical protein
MIPKAFYTMLLSKPTNATAEISFVEFFLLESLTEILAHRRHSTAAWCT